MENLVCINQQPLVIKEYQGQRVVTFKDIDNVHNRTEGTAHRNFKSNKKHFVEGVDYFRRNSSEAKTEYNIIAPNGIILVTETGYLMLAKSFTDDLAWKVQRQLVNCYFKRNQQLQCEQLQLDEPYEYVEKHWKGQLVVTKKDLEKLGQGFTHNNLTYYIKSRLKKNVDFFLLTGDELVMFKKENPSVSGYISGLYLITYSGFKKLVKIIGGKCEELMKLQTTELSTEVKPKEKTQMMDTPNYAQAQSVIGDIMSKLSAIDEVTRGINRYLDVDKHENYVAVAVNMCVELSLLMQNLADMKIPTVNKKW